jgi:nucleoside-diphosphate-sugar epimerase
MRVLVSGASGFLGSWIVRSLISDHEVCALVRKTSNLRNLELLEKLQIRFIESDFLGDFILESNFDVLIVNDWWGVGNEYRNHQNQFQNVDRILNLVCLAVDNGVKTIIGVGSQAELGPVLSDIADDEPDNPTTLYGEAKIRTRELIQKILLGSDIRFVWMRIFSTYGPLDEGSWFIPNTIMSLDQNIPMRMTKGEQEWSYLHAHDLGEAFKMVIGDSKIIGVVNVGNTQTIKISEVAAIIGRVLDRENLLEFGAIEYRPDQVMRLQPTCKKLTSLGWRPQISFEEGIKQTINWFQRSELLPIITEDGERLFFNLPERL